MVARNVGDVVVGTVGEAGAPSKAAAERGAWVGARLRRVATYTALGVAAFVCGGLVALQPGVRSALSGTALGRALSLTAGEATVTFEVHPQELTAPPVAAVGQPLSVAYSVAYTGADRLNNAWTATLLLSTSRIVGPDAAMVAEFREAAQTSGGIVRRQAVVTVPNVPPGDYLLVLRVAANQATGAGTADLVAPLRVGR